MTTNTVPCKQRTDGKKLAKVAKDGRRVKYTSEIKLSNEEDAPMTLAVDRKVSLQERRR